MLKRIHGGVTWKERVEDFSTNLNPLGPPNEVKQKISYCIEKEVYKYYPDPSYDDLKKTLADFYGVKYSNLVVTNGASEAISLVLKCIALRGVKELILVSPTFGEEEILSLAGELKVKVENFMLKEEDDRFKLDLDALIDFIDKKERFTILLSNPNNPTGMYIDLNCIEEVLDHVKDKGLLIIDEAYIELSGKRSSVQLLRGNLVIIRTLTKLFATPGLRVGAVITENSNIISCVDRIRPTWNIDSLSACTYAGEPLESEEWRRRFIEESVEKVREWRSILLKGAKNLGFKVFNSEANFVLVKNDIIKPKTFYDHLMKKGIKVRNCSSFKGLDERYVRIAVKEPIKISLLLNSLKEVVTF
jgi:threonine-phosphate decarboxylase